jgi:hypothetical protein
MNNWIHICLACKSCMKSCAESYTDSYTCRRPPSRNDRSTVIKIVLLYTHLESEHCLSLFFDDVALLVRRVVDGHLLVCEHVPVDPDPLAFHSSLAQHDVVSGLARRREEVSGVGGGDGGHQEQDGENE